MLRKIKMVEKLFSRETDMPRDRNYCLLKNGEFCVQVNQVGAQSKAQKLRQPKVLVL